MPASVTFPEFTDEDVFLQDREAANTLFGSLEVPDATTLSEGVVKKAASVTGSGDISSAFALTTITIAVLDADGNQHVAEVCLKSEVQTALNALRTKLNALIAAMQAAGSLE